MWQALLRPERLQSSPRRILDWPSDPVCSMLKARAIIGSWCGKGKSLLVCLCKVSKEHCVVLQPFRGSERSGHASLLDFCGDLVCHHFPVWAGAVVLDCLVDVLPVVG